jgi:hypothetical protein
VLKFKKNNSGAKRLNEATFAREPYDVMRVKNASVKCVCSVVASAIGKKDKMAFQAKPDKCVLRILLILSKETYQILCILLM